MTLFELGLQIFVYKDAKGVQHIIYLRKVKKKDLRATKAKITRNYNQKNFELIYLYRNDCSTILLQGRQIVMEGPEYKQITITPSHFSLYGGQDKAGMKFFK